MFNKMLLQVGERSFITQEIFGKYSRLSMAEKRIEPTADHRFNIHNVAKDACLYSELISSHGLSMPQLYQIYAESEKLVGHENYNFKSNVCLTKDRHQNYNRKTCLSRNTLFGGTNQCCSYWDYIKENIRWVL